MKAAVTGIGWIVGTGGGSGREERHCAWDAEMPPAVNPDICFDEPHRGFKRLDPYSRFGIAAVSLAIRDAGRGEGGTDEWGERCGIIATTVHGCLEADLAYLDTVFSDLGNLASPSLFAYTLSSAFAGEAAIRFGLGGPGYVLNVKDDDGMLSVAMAVDSLCQREADAMVCGFCDAGRPDRVPCAGGTPRAHRRGAVFLVIEAYPLADIAPYGFLQRAPGGDIHFNHRRVGSLMDLIAGALAALPRG